MRLPLLFTLSLLSGLAGTAQQINGSYLNTTRPGGGPISTGDILEIRAVIAVNSGTTLNGLTYTDVVPTGTSFVSGSLSVVTNEDQVVAAIPNTGVYTDAADGDRGQIIGRNITIFMGTGATSTAGGTIQGGSTTPVFQTGTSILMVVYKVTVTAALGASFTTAGTFSYKIGSSTTVTATPVPSNTLAVSQAYACSSPGSTNFVTAESNGTFNHNTSTNRATSSTLVTGLSFVNLAANNPSDGQYSIVNNTSPTVYSAGGTPASGDKVFGVWDVVGDHTNATNTANGNAPTATNADGGYLLAVNATYTPAVVFSSTISGLLANSTYTISLWVRNICPVCGNNPATGAATTTPGVPPNLAINLNGSNYYSTGNISYTNSWVQKSFTFQNGSSTSAVFEIRNNAPGGGGNDWVLDDISMVQCLFVLHTELSSFTGHATPQGNLLDWSLSPTPELQSFFIERSTDGASFTAIGERPASADSTNYQFADPLLPSANTTLYYRIRMVSRDGATSYSKIISLDTPDQPDMLTTKLSPNPARTTVTLVLWSPAAGSARVLLLAPTGAQVLSRQIAIAAGTNTIPLAIPAHLPTGIYFVRTITNNGSTLNRLLVE